MTHAPSAVAVDLPHRPHRVHIGQYLLVRLGEMLAEHMRPRRAFVVYDEALPDEIVVNATRSLAHHNFVVSSCGVRADETRKTLDTAHRVLQDVAETRHERDEPIVSLGGGIVSDLAGFVAAVYRRGVPAVHCPTTLLAMVDAAVGGKTGVNLETESGLRKNLVGAVWQPLAVFADVTTLASLPERDLRAGLAECVKHAMLGADAGQPDLFDWTVANVGRVLSREPDALTELIERNVRVKAHVVAQDEREERAESESGRLSRMVLNLGHTFAHAIETIAHLSPDGRPEHAPLHHGEAVALGLVAASVCGGALGATDPSVTADVRSALERAGLPTSVAGLPPTGHIVDLMRHDKKVSGGRMRIIVPAARGHVRVVNDPPIECVEAGIEAIREG